MQRESKTYSKYDNCPKCGESWDDGDIPENIRENYSAPYKWSNLISVYSMAQDRTIEYKCPYCMETFSLEEIT